MNEKDFNEKKQKEVDDNFTTFQQLMSDNKIPPEMNGRYALMNSKEIKGYYTTWNDAYQSGLLKYEDKIFSIQEISRNVVDLGYYSHAIA